MGCIWCRLQGETANGKDCAQNTPKFSWEQGPRVDPRDFTIENIDGEVAGCLPGRINGQQFIIANCKNSCIYLFDHINTITVDDCESCIFFIGPVQTSIFIRDCKDCKFIVACQQFRTRDCQRLDCFLCCVSVPIIEASTRLRFGPFCFYYPELLGQFESSNLSPFNCYWSEIHDFTPVAGESNFSLLPEGSAIGDIVRVAAPEGHQLREFIAGKVSTRPEDSVVAQTFGKRPAGLTDEKSLALVFSGREAAMSLIAKAVARPGLRLVRTWQLKLSPSDGQRLLQTTHYQAQFSRGPVICMELNGPQVVPSLQALTQGNDDFYVSSDSGVAERQLDILGGIVNMQMNSQ